MFPEEKMMGVKKKTHRAKYYYEQKWKNFFIIFCSLLAIALFTACFENRKHRHKHGLSLFARYIMPRLYIGKQYCKAYDNNIKANEKNVEVERKFFEKTKISEKNSWSLIVNLSINDSCLVFKWYKQTSNWL